MSDNKMLRLKIFKSAYVTYIYICIIIYILRNETNGFSKASERYWFLREDRRKLVFTVEEKTLPP